MVLPYYEAEFKPDNDVSRESQPTQLFHQALHFLNSLFMKAPSKLNPNYLPFILSKILSDKKVVLYNDKLRVRLEELLELYHKCDPRDKRALRALGYRLEPLRAKL
jgi:hypothetical protein